MSQAHAMPSPVTSPPARSLQNRQRTQRKPLVAARNVTMNQRRTKQQLEDAKPKIDPLERLRTNLSRYTRTNDRRMMIRTLKDCSKLRAIALENIEQGEPSKLLQKLPELELEVCMAELLVNGISFGKPKISKDAPLRKPSKEPLALLQKLCAQLAATAADSAPPSSQDSADKKCSAEEIYHQLLLRLARSTASSDAYFQLNALLGCAELVVQPPKKAQPLPTDATLYQTQGMIHAVTTTRHPYGLFRKSDLAPSHIGGPKRPWIRIMASVVERINLTTGASVRHCSVHIQEK